MTILVTGVAGFIGMHVAARLLARGERVVGIDALTSYYDPALKRARLLQLEGQALSGQAEFSFERCDFSDHVAMAGLVGRHPEIDRVIHLGAQPGVRHSIERPYEYLEANLAGHLVMLETCRMLAGRPGGLRHFVYASSSSVYGGGSGSGDAGPFVETQRTDQPLSLYAASKKSCEAMSYAYAHLYRFPATGLRFFTVYGPWGRPDMAPYIFASKILAGEKIDVFNNGEMKRDFTYIDDIVLGTVAALDHPAKAEEGAAHALYNLGGGASVGLMDYIRAIEDACGKKADIAFCAMQPGEVVETAADITAARRDLGYVPAVPVAEGVPRFVDWLRTYHNL